MRIKYILRIFKHNIAQTKRGSAITKGPHIINDDLVLVKPKGVLSRAKDVQSQRVGR